MNKKTINQPLVSVVMPVYNAGEFVTQAVESILSQTYQNFEFIIVDDHSTDNSWKILNRFAKQDKRIKLFRNKKNEGVSHTVKKAINKTKGAFLARMDADDIAIVDRLEKQVSYLKKNKETVAVGGQCFVINKESVIVGEKRFPVRFEDIYKYIFTLIPVQQPTLMIAKNRLPKNFEYYRDGMNTAEEVELYFKLFAHGKVENLSDHLLLYRIHSNNTSFKNLRQTFFLTMLSRIKAIKTYHYKPTLSGVLITLAEAFIVLVLPQKLTLGLYSLVKGMNFSSSPVLSTHKALQKTV